MFGVTALSSFFSCNKFFSSFLLQSSDMSFIYDLASCVAVETQNLAVVCSRCECHLTIDSNLRLVASLNACCCSKLSFSQKGVLCQLVGGDSFGLLCRRETFWKSDVDVLSFFLFIGHRDFSLQR